MLLLVLKILGGVLALGIGLFWGLSGQFRQTPEEIDQALGLGGRTRKTKRHFTPLGWMRKDQRASHRRRQSRQPFKTVAPKGPPPPRPRSGP